jgi:NAD-dependent deacetylase
MIRSATEVGIAADLIIQAQRPVALTGAGISTPSGIPDFRSPGTGLWQRFNPMEVASLSAFRSQPEKFYVWIRPLLRTILEAVPNAAHIALADLEKKGCLTGVVTQNVDGLHQRAGSERVIEVHGNMRTATCVSCFRHFTTEPYIAALLQTGEIPRCSDCGNILKPDVVLFEEQLPAAAVREAESLMSGVDLLIVVGSSLDVMPASMLPVAALNNGARLIILNHEPTYLDGRAEVILRQDVAEILPLVTSEVLGA